MFRLFFCQWLEVVRGRRKGDVRGHVVDDYGDAEVVGVGSEDVF